jgi:hypothetical protein
LKLENNLTVAGASGTVGGVLPVTLPLLPQAVSSRKESVNKVTNFILKFLINIEVYPSFCYFGD